MCKCRKGGGGGSTAAKPDLEVCPHKVGFSIARMRYNYQIEAQVVLMLPKVSSVCVFVRCRKDRFKRYLQFSDRKSTQ